MKIQRCIRLFFALVAIVASCLISYISVKNPLKNWDIVGYTATALAKNGLRDVELHSETWKSLRKEFGDVSILQKGNNYMETIAHSPEALEQQLPYYKPRVAYIFLTSQLSNITGIEFPGATVLVSALSISILFLLVYFTLTNYFPAPTALLLTLSLTACLHWLWLSRASTPDAMAALLIFGAALAFRQKHPLFFIVSCSILIFVRHDQIILAGLLAIFHQDLKKWQKSACIILFFSIFSGIYFYSKWYGWPLLFMHTFSTPQAYPTSSNVVLSDVWTQYLTQWISIITSMAKETQTLLPIAAIIIATFTRKQASHNDRCLIDALTCAMVVKITIFPAISGSWSRLYMGEIVSIFVIAMIIAKDKISINSNKNILSL